MKKSDVEIKKVPYFKASIVDGKVKLEVGGMLPLQVISLCTGVISTALGQHMKQEANKISKPTIAETMELNKNVN